MPFIPWIFAIDRLARLEDGIRNIRIKRRDVWVVFAFPRAVVGGTASIEVARIRIKVWFDQAQDNIADKSGPNNGQKNSSNNNPCGQT